MNNDLPIPVDRIEKRIDESPARHFIEFLVTELNRLRVSRHEYPEFARFEFNEPENDFHRERLACDFVQNRSRVLEGAHSKLQIGIGSLYDHPQRRSELPFRPISHTSPIRCPVHRAEPVRILSARNLLVTHLSRWRVPDEQQVAVLGAGCSVNHYPLEADPETISIVNAALAGSAWLWSAAAPKFVVLHDPAYQLGFGPAADDFRAILVDRMRGSDAILLYPVRFHALAHRHLAPIRDHLCPVAPAMTWAVGQSSACENPLLLQVRIASRLSKTISFWGFDGRTLSGRMTTPVWTASFNRCYPDFPFQQQQATEHLWDPSCLRPDDTIDDFVEQRIEDELARLENSGTRLSTMHPSWNAPLQRRERKWAFPKRLSGKLAFLLLTQEHLPHEDYWKAFLDQAGENCSLYLYSLTGNFESKYFASHVIPSRAPSEDGSTRNDYPELILLRAAYSAPANSKFVLLTEDCFPCRNFESVYGVLMRDSRSRFSYFRLETDRSSGCPRAARPANTGTMKSSKHLVLNRMHVRFLLEASLAAETFQEFAPTVLQAQGCLGADEVEPYDCVFHPPFLVENWTDERIASLANAGASDLLFISNVGFGCDLLPIAEQLELKSTSIASEEIPESEFDEEYYLRTHPDVAQAVLRGTYASG